MNAKRLHALTIIVTLLFPLRLAAQPPEERAEPRREPARDAELLAAYKKEFAFLEVEKNTLGERLVALREEGRREEAKARRAGETLTKRLIELRRDTDRLEQALRTAELDAGAAEESADRLDDMLSRARATLAGAGRELPEPPPLDETSAAPTPARTTRAEEARALLDAFVTLVEDTRTIRRESGSFFLPAGARVEGEILRIGEIAAFGSAGDTRGALAPAGARRLKLWGDHGAGTATALAAGTPVSTLSLFLFDSLDKEVEQRSERTFAEFLSAGGVVAYAIAVLGAVALLLVILRVCLLLSVGAGPGRILRRVLPLLDRGDGDAALATAERSRGAAARVVAAVLRNRRCDRPALEGAATEALLCEAPPIERFSTTITVLAAVAPLLGLLGTVTGMIATFDVITEHGTGDPKLLSGGISEALITTKLGLLVAVPTLLVGTLLSGRADGLLRALEHTALRVMNAVAAPRTDESTSGEQAGDGAPSPPPGEE